MAKLREADKALKEAEIGVQNAIAAIKNAIADKIAAEAKAQEIENDYQKALKEAQLDEEKAKIQKALDDLAKQRELDDIKHAKKVAKAEAAYEEALLEIEMRMRDLKLAAKDLSPKEKQMLISSAAAYAAAQKALAEQALVVMKKEQDLKEAEAEFKLFEASAEPGTIFETEVERLAKLGELKAAKEELEGEMTELEIEKNKAELLDLRYKVDDYNYYNDWVRQTEDYERQIKNVEINKDRYINDVADYYAYTVHDAVTDIQKHIEDFMTMNPEPAKDAKEDVVAAFETAMKDFVGTHVDEKTEKEVYNIEYKALASWLPVKEFKGNQTEEIVAYLQELAEKFYEVNKLGDFEGQKVGMLYDYAVGRVSNLLGELRYFQDYKKNNEEMIVHLTIMKEAAQAAALVYAQANEFVEEVGEVTIDSEKYDDWADLVEAYNKAKDEYIAELEKQIEEKGEARDELDAQYKAVDANDITFYYKEKLAKATIALEMAEKVQGGLQKAADQLKSIYKKVYDMVSENYEGVIDFSSLLGLGDMDDLGNILDQAGKLNGVFADFMDLLKSLQN